VISPAENVRSRDKQEVGVQTELANYSTFGTQTEMASYSSLGTQTAGFF
jgi:hypothetical protein